MRSLISTIDPAQVPNALRRASSRPDGGRTCSSSIGDCPFQDGSLSELAFVELSPLLFPERMHSRSYLPSGVAPLMRKFS